MSNNFRHYLTRESNFTRTENNALTLRSSTNPVLDLFSMGGALRSRTPEEITALMLQAVFYDPQLAIKCLFYLRDIRGGQGERRTFRIIWKYLAQNFPTNVEHLIDQIPIYGRWDDLFCLRDTPLEDKMLQLLYIRMQVDIAKPEDNPSLVWKWLPSINTSSKQTRELAKWLYPKLGFSSEKEYRKKLSSFRKKLRIVERKMCAQQWTDINYEAVPSNAAMRYANAFKTHDPEGYQSYLDQVKNGEKTIKTATLYPYDLIRKAISQYTPTLEVQWQHLPDYCQGKAANSIAVVDSSASMTWNDALSKAVSLALYFAERTTGPWHNSFITFSEDAQLLTIQGTTLQEKYQYIETLNICQNTNLQSVFDLILRTAHKYRIPQAEMIERIYIISDMEFDRGSTANHTNFQEIQRKYAASGYEMPTLIYWNVESRHNNVPTYVNQEKVALVSGCSPSIFKQLMSLEWKTPEDVMLETLQQERYACLTWRGKIRER